MKKKGFTLIEMMMALAIFSIFVVFLYNAYFSQIKENNSFNNRLDLKYNGDKAMNLITDELRSNVIPLSTSNITQVISNGNVFTNIPGSISSSKLQLTSQNTLVDNNSSPSMVLCKEINSITLQYNIDLIIITIDLRSKNDQYTVTSAVNINK